MAWSNGVRVCSAAFAVPHKLRKRLPAPELRAWLAPQHRGLPTSPPISPRPQDAALLGQLELLDSAEEMKAYVKQACGASTKRFGR